MISQYQLHDEVGLLMTNFKERGKKISKCAYNFLLPLANTLQVLKGTQSRTSLAVCSSQASVGLLGHWSVVSCPKAGASASCFLPYQLCLLVWVETWEKTYWGKVTDLERWQKDWKWILCEHEAWCVLVMCAGSPETQGPWADPQQQGQDKGGDSTPLLR